MEKPGLKLEKQFNSIGIFLEEKNSFKPTTKAVGIIVEVGFPLDTVLESLDFDVVTVNPRGVKTRFTEFDLSERDDQKILAFKAYQELPLGVDVPLTSKPLATSFVDLCWYTGIEAVNKDLIPSVVTKKQANTESADLGWYLPSRFVDSVINALGKINETFLSGTLEDAILYGPITKEQS